MSQTLSSGHRKYTAILETLVKDAVCRVECKLADASTIMNGVKKEKGKWKDKNKWPKGKALDIQIIDETDYKGLIFRMKLDTSVNNL